MMKNSKRKCGLACSSADFVLSRIYSSFRTTKELWSKVLLEEEEQEQVLGGWAYNVVMDWEQLKRRGPSPLKFLTGY